MRSLLIPLTYVCLQTCLGTTQEIRLEVLNMAPDALDDQYIGCDNEMDKNAPALLEDEKSKSDLLREVWDNAKNHWQTVKKFSSGLKDEYGIAIVAYTDQRKYNNPEAFPTVFKEAVRENRKSQAGDKSKFPFTAFHYYLTRALQLLRGNCNEMYKQTVYRGGSNAKYNYAGGLIRFGHFASSSFSKEEAKKFGTFAFFTIHTCFGVDISKFSYNPEQKEVLIPVHEEFNVSQEDGTNRFVLESTKRTCSHFNCAYPDGKKSYVCVYNSATRGGVTFPGGMSPSLFGGSIILIHAAALKLTASF